MSDVDVKEKVKVGCSPALKQAGREKAVKSGQRLLGGVWHETGWDVQEDGRREALLELGALPAVRGEATLAPQLGRGLLGLA